MQVSAVEVRISLLQGGGTLLHQADGSDLIVFHAYDATTGRPALQTSSLVWRDGWPVATLGEE
jgi:arabinan endo-1,5-alpha-L-arabinosidase